MKRLLLSFLVVSSAFSAEYTADQYYREGQRMDQRGDYFTAARYYFQGVQKTQLLSEKAMGNALTGNSLSAAGLFQSASYFFLQAIGSADDKAIRMALTSAPQLLDNVGSAIFKKYLLRYTKIEQYNEEQRDYYLYLLSQDHLLNQRPQQALTWSSQIDNDFPNYPSVLFMRGTSYLLTNQVDPAIEAFKDCLSKVEKSKYTKTSTPAEVKELKNRCIAGIARAYYQGRKYQDADHWYDQVELSSFVWPQVQYERAWTSIAKGDYNRALGRLISYKSPGLSWFRDSEVDMLRALSYLQMCIYDEADNETELFTKRFASTSEKISSLLKESEKGSTESLVKLFKLGADATKQKVQSEDELVQVFNRFVRSPYFVRLVQSGDRVAQELGFLTGQGSAAKYGLGAFLKDELVWKWQTSQELGGYFVRDRLATEHKALMANIQTMDIVKLEMLRRKKNKIENSDINLGLDVWGNKKRGSLGRPRLRDEQYFWDFNGEFWADELGDYLLALKPECT